MDVALGEGGALDPLRDESAGRLGAWLESGGEAAIGGTVEIVLRSDDPDDLSLREARLLGSADVLACEPAVPQAIVDRARADARRISLSLNAPPPVLPGFVVVLRAHRQSTPVAR